MTNKVLGLQPWTWFGLGAGAVAVLLTAVAVFAPPRPPAGPAVYDRDEFRSLLVGKTEAEVLDLVGRPDSTQDAAAGRAWYYDRRTRDPVTGKTDARVQVLFAGDRVASVNFY